MSVAILVLLIVAAAVLWRLCHRSNTSEQEAALGKRLRADLCRAEALAELPEPKGTAERPRKHASYGPNSQARAYMEVRR